jgi:nucleotide-binding universal stress UspA family protein
MTKPAHDTGPVLLITDLSARCDRAMDRAVRIAKSRGVALIALNVIDTPWLTKLTQPAWRSLQQEHIAQAQKRLRADLSHASVDLHVRVETGNPVEVIEQIINEYQCKLIVAGTARDETLGRILVGNTVERLARRTTTPLLVVRARPFGPYTRTVVATDFSEGSRQALLAAMGLCGEAPPTLYHAFDQVAGIYQLDEPTVAEEIQALKKTAAEFVRATLGQNSVTLPFVIEHGIAEHLLPAYVESHDIELVAMGTQGATGLVRTAMGSVAEILLTNLQCDVLVVPQTNR